MLARFEHLMEQAIEGGLRRVFPTALQPVQLAKAAARAMERSRVVGVQGVQVPNRYELHLSATDLQRFGALRPRVSEDVRAYLHDYADERGMRPVGEIRVELIEDRRQKTGAVRATASYVDLAPAQQEEVHRAVAATRRLQLQELALAQPGGPARAAPEHLYLSQGGHSFTLEPGFEVVRLGRAIDNDLVVDSQRVSRYHAQLRWVDSAWLVYDLDSTNGTWLDSERVAPDRPELLRVGARLRLGDVDLEVLRKVAARGRN